MNVAFAFDLDGTVTCEELLPLIAKEIGLEEEMSFLTDLTINSVIPFDISFKLRFALLKAIRLSAIQNVTENARLDEHISNFIKKHNDKCYIVTDNVDHWVAPIIKKLDCKIFSSKVHCEDGYCTELLSINNKAEAIYEINKKHDFIVSIGKGANNISTFKESNMSICCGGGDPPNKDLFAYLNYVIFEGKMLCNLLNTLL